MEKNVILQTEVDYIIVYFFYFYQVFTYCYNNPENYIYGV